jgi:hypothetical protein
MKKLLQTWAQMKNTYTPWHVNHKPPTPLPIAQENAFIDEMKTPHPMDLDEWEMLSQLHPTNDIQISDLDMLGHHDFDNNHNWNTTSIPFNLQEIAIQFIENNHSHHQLPQPCYSNTPSSKTLSPTQLKSLSIVLKHSTEKITTLH